MSRFRQFGDILKVEDQPDGTIMVYGVASSPSRDHAGEVVTSEAMKAALPDYAKFPALREMHSASAAGRVIEADVDDDGVTNIVAHVVDPVAVTKVKTKTYAGFSIGGKVLKRDPNDRSTITSLRLAEISLVDSPCNPDAALTMWKADMSDYNPTAEETVAEAKTLAMAVGSTRYKDFLYKAREGLIAKRLADEIEDETEQPEAVGAEPVAKADGVEAPAAEPVAAAVDPVAALADALGKAADAATPAVEADTGLADLSKSVDIVLAGLPGVETQIEPIAKSLYSVSYLAEVLGSLRSLLNQVTNYGEGGNAGSTVPVEIATAIRDLGSTLVTLAQEEVAVLLTSAGNLLPDIEIIELAQLVDMTKANDVVMAKAGARNSKADSERIQKSHDHMAALGATCDADNCGDTEKMAGLEAENARLAKALADAAPAVEDITKRFNETVDTLRGEVSALTKRLEQVEDSPAPPKTAASTHAVTKTQDAAQIATPAGQLTADEFHKHLAALPEKDRGEMLLRVALKNPHLVQPARAAV